MAHGFFEAFHLLLSCAIFLSLVENVWLRIARWYGLSHYPAGLTILSEILAWNPSWMSQFIDFEVAFERKPISCQLSMALETRGQPCYQIIFLHTTHIKTNTQASIPCCIRSSPEDGGGAQTKPRKRKHGADLDNPTGGQDTSCMPSTCTEESSLLASTCEDAMSMLQKLGSDIRSGYTMYGRF